MKIFDSLDISKTFSLEITALLHEVCLAHSIHTLNHIKALMCHYFLQ